MNSGIVTSREGVRVDLELDPDRDCLIIFVPSSVLDPARSWGSAELTATEARTLALQLLAFAAALDAPAVDKPLTPPA